MDALVPGDALKGRNQEIDEASYLQRQLFPRGIDGIDTEHAGVVIGQTSTSPLRILPNSDSSRTILTVPVYGPAEAEMPRIREGSVCACPLWSVAKMRSIAQIAASADKRASAGNDAKEGGGGGMSP